MPSRAFRQSALWAGAGTAVLVVAFAVTFHFWSPGASVAALASNARRAGLVDAMRVHLHAGAAAEKNTLLAAKDEEARRFADASRAETAQVEDARVELEAATARDGTGEERELVAKFATPFDELRRIDAEVLGLAVENSNVKAQALAFGPATVEVGVLDAALTRIAARGEASADVARLATSARCEAWKLLALLPPHIAEESDARMTAMEAAMTRTGDELNADLDALSKAESAADADLEAARSSAARYAETRREILALSRANTNVRSLALSLNQKRNALGLCEEALLALERAIADEPVRAVTREAPINPRRP